MSEVRRFKVKKFSKTVVVEAAHVRFEGNYVMFYDMHYNLIVAFESRDALEVSTLDSNSPTSTSPTLNSPTEPQPAPDYR